MHEGGYPRAARTGGAVLLIGLMAMGGILAGCSETAREPDAAYLIRVDGATMTPLDFNRALEIALTAYPYDIAKDPEAFREARIEHFRQMVERMLLTARARELGVGLAEAEVRKAVAEARKGYPEGEFERALLESAITYEDWEKELRARLLMEKVVDMDLGNRITVTDKEVARYRARHPEPADVPPKEDGERLPAPDPEEILRRRKLEAGYGDYIEGLRKRYPLEINKEQWLKIVGS